MKPLLVDWIRCSWIKLKDRTALIVKGWEKAGMGKVLDAAKQVDALKFFMDKGGSG